MGLLHEPFRKYGFNMSNFDPVNAGAYICLVCSRSKSNGIDVFPPRPTAEAYASTKGTVTFSEKEAHLACYTKQR